MGTGMVIVGAGECGVRAALTFRELGYQGPTTLIGHEAHLPYERPPLSKEAMIAEAPSIKAIASEAELAEKTIVHLRSVAVQSIDRAAKSVQLSDGRELTYEKL